MRDRTRIQFMCVSMTILLLFIMVPAVSGAVYASNDGVVKLEMGEEIQSQITLYNPRGEQDTFSVTVTPPTMSQGMLVANILVDAQQADTLDVDVGAEKNRTITVSYVAASCTASICSGDVTITARSLETGSVYSTTIPTTITRRQEIYGSPGITGVEIIVLAVLATVSITLMGQNGRWFRRRSDNPDK